MCCDGCWEYVCLFVCSFRSLKVGMGIGLMGRRMFGTIYASYGFMLPEWREGVWWEGGYLSAEGGVRVDA